jgi:hypothetical protein
LKEKEKEKEKEMQACITESGIPGIGKIPLSFHFCNFYRNRQDLIDTLIPYFAAGLQNQERCIWMTAQPFPAEEAKKELAQVVPSLESMIAQGQITISDANAWNAKSDSKDIVKQWLNIEETALAQGYKGLRIAGNTSFLSHESWHAFMIYEEAADRAFRARRITCLCSYRLTDCSATDVFEVARIHDAALAADHEGAWILLPERLPPTAQ